MKPDTEGFDLASLFADMEVETAPKKSRRAPKATVASLREKVESGINVDPVELEPSRRCWFSYRRLKPFHRTCLFVFSYDAVLSRRFAHMNGGNLSLTRSGAAGLSMLKREEKEAPWAKQADGKAPVVSQRWKSFVAARRQADMWFMNYEDYVSGAVYAMERRGWPHTNAPQPGMLTSAKILGGVDRFEQATIPWYFRDLYRDVVRFCPDAYFLPAFFRADPLQLEYLGYIAGTLRLTTGDRAPDLWRRYQLDGKIVSSLSYDDALKHYIAFQ